eukprot:Nk52_evm34s272 gene=Nk52_evmTU34s272
MGYEIKNCEKRLSTSDVEAAEDRDGGDDIKLLDIELSANRPTNTIIESLARRCVVVSCMLVFVLGLEHPFNFPRNDGIRVLLYLTTGYEIVHVLYMGVYCVCKKTSVTIEEAGLAAKKATDNVARLWMFVVAWYVIELASNTGSFMFDDWGGSPRSIYSAMFWLVYSVMQLIVIACVRL